MKSRSMVFFRKRTLCCICILLLTACCSSAGIITPLTFDGVSVLQEYPAVDGNLVVWSDNREGLYATYLYNTLTGNETRISPADSFTPQHPRISGTYIVYQNDSMVFPDIFLYNVQSGATIQVTSDPVSEEKNPAISGSLIVWEDTRSGTPDVYVYNISSGTESVVSPFPSSKINPDISGDLVVWQDDRNGDQDIYLYNLTSSEEIRITDDSSQQTFPAIDGNLIAWMDLRNDPANNEIFINGTEPGQEFSITPDGVAENHLSPAIHGRNVIWQQGDSAIYMNDTSPGLFSLTPIDTVPGSMPTHPRISYDPVYGDRVVWQEQSDSEIYLYTSGSSDLCPVSNFTHDFNGGAAPVTVHFTDHSDPASATHWLWDFGDGTTSTLQNPSHRYTDNLSYDVSLVTGNPYCRNMTTVPGSVVVGRPVAAFTASPTSEIVPAVITFTDRSGGSPSSWLWEFGDGDTSADQNPVHTYAAPGTYTVNLTAANAYGSSLVSRTGYISILNGANLVSNTTIAGLTITNCGGPQSVTVDTGVLPATLSSGNTVLQITPPADRGFSSITVYSRDGVGFAEAGGIITGNVTGVRLETPEIHPQGFSGTIGGSRISVGYTADLASYPCNALLRTVIWESATADDGRFFQRIALDSNFAHYSGTAYTTRITKTNFPAVTAARFRMSVDSGWVASFTDGRNQTFIERISDDRTTGEVLATEFISHDSGNNVDIFEASSPRGLSTFGLSALSGSGNPLQLITLSVTSHINPAEPSAPVSESDTGMGAAGVTTKATTAPVPTPSPTATQETRVTVNPGVSAKIYTNPQGVVTQETRLTSPDGRATITIGEGITALDAAGKPLEKITIRVLSAADLPPVPSGSVFVFDGLAYEIEPEGATFSPPISLSFTPVQPRLGREYSVKTHDKKSGTWQDLPTTFDGSTGVVTAPVSHLSVYALFTRASTAPPTIAKTPALPTVVPQQAKAQPPTTAVSIFMSMTGWIVDLAVKNLAVVAVIIVVCGAVFFILRGRRPGSWD